MRANRTIGAAILVTASGLLTLGGCDLVINVGTYCTVGVDPGCGASDTGGTTTSTSGGSGGGGTGGSTTTGGQGGSTSSSTGGAPECGVGATQDCYAGPNGTKGIGICKGGIQTCQQDGTWGVCEGDVLPGTETCATDDDEDCNGTECALWSYLLGDAENQAVTELRVSPDGNIVLAGFFDGSMTGLNPPLQSAGLSDIFVLKIKPNGDVLWAKRWGDGDDQSRVSLAVDGQGNIILAGSYHGTLDFGGGNGLPPQGMDDIYVVKLDPDGNTIWAKGIGDAKGQTAWDVATNDVGDIYVVGSFAGTVNFGDGPVTAAGTNLPDAFIAKYGSNGSLAWKRILGDNMSQGAASVAVDSAGDAVFSGNNFGTISYKGMMFSDGQPYVAKISNAGADLWLKTFPVSSSSLAVGPNGNYWMFGSVALSVDFGGGTLSPLGGGDAYIAKFDSTGAYLKAQRFGSAGAENIADIAFDNTGAAIATGTFDSGIDFGGGPLLSAGLVDFFVAKFDDGLNLSWARRFGDDKSQLFTHVTSDATNAIYVTAKIDGTINFGTGDLTSNGNDIAIAKLTP